MDVGLSSDPVLLFEIVVSVDAGDAFERICHRSFRFFGVAIFASGDFALLDRALGDDDLFPSFFPSILEDDFFASFDAEVFEDDFFPFTKVDFGMMQRRMENFALPI